MALKRAIYQLGERIRNPEIKRHRDQLQLSDHWPIEKLESLQLVRLRDLLLHAKRYSPYYANILESYDIESFAISDLQTLPVLDKPTLMANMRDIESHEQKGKVFKSSTSGSTGQSMKFQRNLEWDAAARAAQYRGYEWYGVKPWFKNLYFWGFNYQFSQLLVSRVLDFLVNRKRVFSYDADSLNRTKKYLEKCDYIEGYSSALYTLSQQYEKKGIKFPNIKLVKGTSEKIFDLYHAPVKKVFGVKMTSEYGSAETGIIAFECPNESMHIAMENVIVESIDNEIVVTNLFSFSLPIIRYKLGDYIDLDDQSQCQCGRGHHIIKEVTGRVGKNIIDKDGEYPALYLYYVFKNISLQSGLDLAYQAEQSEIGVLSLKVIYDGNDAERVKSLVQNEVKKLFSGSLIVNIEMCLEVNQSSSKTQAFRSML